MPYLPFPPNWSFFTAKDKLGDWFEAYASIMELNVWNSTTITKSTYDDAAHTWTVDVKRGNGEMRTLKPRHVIFCTGHSGEPKIPSFPGQDTFTGIVHHASQHKDAGSSDVSGKKVIVVGTGNSGHDIAQNFCDNGASVTMLQRSPTHVVSADIGLLMLTEALYGENSPPTEDADLYAQSIPNQIGFAMVRPTVKAISEKEKETLDGLTKAGFKLSSGVDGGGLFSLYLTRGGGYYIDVGCSKLIVEGKIKVVQSPKGIKEFEKDKLVLADGTKLDADIVVLATGYDNMKTSLQKALGEEEASRCKDVWDLDAEGELNAVSSFSFSSLSRIRIN
jgi:cation diffusion facilitator CzcD-associated flavoprotein CzcO